MSCKSYRSVKSGSSKSDERLPLIFAPPKSYGALFPYFQFVKSTSARAAQVSKYKIVALNS